MPPGRWSKTECERIHEEVYVNLAKLPERVWKVYSKWHYGWQIVQGHPIKSIIQLWHSRCTRQASNSHSHIRPPPPVATSATPEMISIAKLGVVTLWTTRPPTPANGSIHFAEGWRAVCVQFALHWGIQQSYPSSSYGQGDWIRSQPSSDGVKGSSCAIPGCDAKVMSDQRGEDILPCGCDKE